MRSSWIIIASAVLAASFGAGTAHASPLVEYPLLLQTGEALRSFQSTFARNVTQAERALAIVEASALDKPLPSSDAQVRDGDIYEERVIYEVEGYQARSGRMDNTPIRIERKVFKSPGGLTVDSVGGAN